MAQRKIIEDGLGHPLTSYWHAPAQAPIAVAIIAPAIGIPQSYYRTFASWLAEQGLLAVTFDYAGSGESLHGRLRDPTLQDELIAEDEESRVRHDLLMDAMEGLNERERHILTERRLTDDPKTLEELSQVYGVTRERIRQIESKTMSKLRHPSRSQVLRDYLEELSQVYGVSRERIRQIEVRAFEKLQAGLIKLAGEKKLLPAA